MAQHPFDDSSASPRLRRIRKLIAEAKRKQRHPKNHEPLAGRGPVKPPSDLAPVWSSALSRVKQHIQTSRRHRTPAG